MLTTSWLSFSQYVVQFRRELSRETRKETQLKFDKMCIRDRWVTSFIVFPNNTSETFRLDSFYEPRDTVQTTRVHDNSLIFRSEMCIRDRHIPPAVFLISSGSRLYVFPPCDSSYTYVSLHSVNISKPPNSLRFTIHFTIICNIC